MGSMLSYIYSSTMDPSWVIEKIWKDMKRCFTLRISCVLLFYRESGLCKSCEAAYVRKAEAVSRARASKNKRCLWVRTYKLYYKLTDWLLMTESCWLFEIVSSSLIMFTPVFMWSIVIHCFSCFLLCPGSFERGRPLAPSTGWHWGIPAWRVPQHL